MNALTIEKLDALVAVRNAKGLEYTVEVMNKEELASYRINCTEAIARNEKRMAKSKPGNAMQQAYIETMDLLTGFIAYIDARLSEVEEPKGVAVIDTFLADWRDKAHKYYTDLRTEFVLQRDKQHELTAEGLKLLPKNAWGGRKYSDEQIDGILSKLEKGELPDYQIDSLKSKVSYEKFSSWLKPFTKAEIGIVSSMNIKGYLDGLLDREVEHKREHLLSRIEKKAGEIIDADGLYIGADGSINGEVVGDKGKVTVKTVYAGGHNIQCLHYRLLVK